VFVFQPPRFFGVWSNSPPQSSSVEMADGSQAGAVHLGALIWGIHRTAGARQVRRADGGRRDAAHFAYSGLNVVGNGGGRYAKQGGYLVLWPVVLVRQNTAEALPRREGSKPELLPSFMPQFDIIDSLAVRVQRKRPQRANGPPPASHTSIQRAVRIPMVSLRFVDPRAT
jgi:hypothetical protein